MRPLTTTAAATATATFLLIITVIVLAFSVDVAESVSSNGSLPNCTHTFSCGKIKNVGYPFSGGPRPANCGLPGFHLDCLNDSITVLTGDDSLSYRVRELDQPHQTLSLSRSDLYETKCTTRFTNTTLNSTFFSLGSGAQVLTLFYGCNASDASDHQYTPENLFQCFMNGSFSDAFYMIGPVPNSLFFDIIHCNASTSVPVLKNWDYWANGSSSIEAVLRDGFLVDYRDPYGDDCEKCRRSGGECGFDAELGKSICICDNRLCSVAGSKSKVSVGVGVGIAGAVVVGIGLGAWLIFFIQRRKRKTVLMQNKFISPPLFSSSKGSKGVITTPSSTNFTQTTSSYQSSKSANLEKGSTYFGVHLFSYTELEEATQHFDSSKELGDGGFGTVYYGELQDGRVVAVKRLYENNLKRAEQFMNEVEILARLRHQNLVSLYGCTSRRSRELLLVYEYIPNGTVADHLHGKRSASSLLTWQIRLSIAIETADALTFLHASDVIHRDVKTNNILLDNNFCVKVADFGLSRLFPNDVTHVSTAPQGTPGYVDPEYYQCYQLTDKSDVYSFGVVLIELISSLPAVDTDRHRQDINLANMAVNKIQNHALSELVDPSLGFENDYAVRRMATSVAELAFRCLQQQRDMRPTMEEVLEALKRTENEYYGAEKAEVVDIRDDDIGLLKNLPPPLSPDQSAVATDKWVSNSIKPSTF